MEESKREESKKIEKKGMPALVESLDYGTQLATIVKAMSTRIAKTADMKKKFDEIPAAVATEMHKMF